MKIHLILLDDNFATIVAAIEEGRAVYANIRKFLTYILTSNIPELVPYLAFVLFNIPLPLTIIQIVNVFLCRSRRESVFRFSLFRNPLILVGIAIELTLILLIDYTPWGNAVFGTAPIPLTVWLFIVPFSLGMLGLEEGRKWLVRSFAERHTHRDLALVATSQHPLPRPQ